MDIVKVVIQAVGRNLEFAKGLTTPEEFQAILQWMEDFVTTNRESRSENPG